MAEKLKVLVLRGGPDREREVSLNSGREVAAALRQAGHEVRESDILPSDQAALDAFAEWPGDVVFPVLHGRWGEGGGLQHILDERGLPYVGCAGPAAELCIDKHRTKLAVARREIPTPRHEVVGTVQKTEIPLPFVAKAIDEGSSIDLFICHTDEDLEEARHALIHRHSKVMVEQFVAGREVTVGVIGALPGEVADKGHHIALPPLEIVPAVAYYDYEAKYTRDDTQYRFDIDLPEQTLQQLREYALEAHSTLGVRHLSRVDFIVDSENQPWFLEINTLPGFTTHSLLPMAAAEAGIAMPDLVDRLVRLALPR